MGIRTLARGRSAAVQGLAAAFLGLAGPLFVLLRFARAGGESLARVISSAVCSDAVFVLHALFRTETNYIIFFSSL